MFYNFVKIIVYLLLLFFTGGIKINGKEKIPAKGPYIIVSNHQSLLDPMVLMVCFPDKIVFLAAFYLFKIPLLRKVISLLGALPIKSEKTDRKSMKQALKLLEQGNVVALFPEGGVSKSGTIQPLLPGWAFLAQKSGVPVLPVIIQGSRNVLPLGSYFPRRGKIRIFVGENIFFGDRQKINREALREVNDRLQLELERMLLV